MRRSHHACAPPPPCRCDGVNGPAHWPGGPASSHCDAAEQSPIDLCGASVHALAPNLTFAAGYGSAHNYRFSADGQAYLDAADLGLTLDAGNLVRQRPSPARPWRGRRRPCAAGSFSGVGGRPMSCPACAWGSTDGSLAGEAEPPGAAGREHHLEACTGPFPLVRWRPLLVPVRGGVMCASLTPARLSMLARSGLRGYVDRGRSKTEGSEHYLEGEQYPLELHFVHVNTAYNGGDINAALASGNPDALLVVGQMFKVGATQTTSMDTIAAGITGGDVAQPRSIVASDLMDTSEGYYTYPGSLTTPTCNPVVTWVVLASAIDVTEVCCRASWHGSWHGRIVSWLHTPVRGHNLTRGCGYARQATLNAFMEISKDGHAVSEKGNYRNLQALGTRQIYRCFAPLVARWLPCLPQCPGVDMGRV